MRGSYVARQPIFTKEGDVAGYELLYRSGQVNAFDFSVEGTRATRELISEVVLNFGVHMMTEGKRGFINFTEDLILDRVPILLDPKQFIIEVLENVSLTPLVLSHLFELRQLGFQIALDDYCGEPLSDAELECFEIVKMDFRETPPQVRREAASRLCRRGKRVLAEKVETEEEYQEAKRLGCELFQGYYFAKPITLKKKRFNIAGATGIRLWQELSENEVDLDKMDYIVQNDAHLFYKLLKQMDTVQYQRGWPIRTAKDALLRMGVDKIRRWVLLVLLEEIAGEEMNEMVRTALVRALFCKRLMEESGEMKLSADAFIVGLFSILDQHDEEFRELLQALGIHDAVLAGLSGADTALGRLLRMVLDYERGEWDDMKTFGCDICSAYVQSVNQADEIMR